jgi:hypothetical protein
MLTPGHWLKIGLTAKHTKALDYLLEISIRKLLVRESENVML